MENGKFVISDHHIESVRICMSTNPNAWYNIIYYIDERMSNIGPAYTDTDPNERATLDTIAGFLHTYCVGFWNGAHSSKYRAAITYANIYLERFAGSMDVNEYIKLYDIH